ncbi:proline-rich receptor-like protein kinase PERK12 [Papaver somniferum]|uniref:proline-rich receptor-like protein kinase PERK12 n=1 Tax=Papaver somniferum TaxID=3469 RepID=UPI000E6F739E|nr:proline-rich receptor-like protein kinase PERK12 [Papaver somniferum]
MARLCKIIFCLMSVLFLVDSVICADADPPSNDAPPPESAADSAPPSPPTDLTGAPVSPPKHNEPNSPPAPPPSTNAPGPSSPKHSPAPSPSAPAASDNPKSPTPAQSPSDDGAADNKKSPAPSPDADIKHVSTDTAGMEEESKGSSSSGGMSGVKKLGISVGVILFVGCIAAGVIVYKKRQDNIARSRYAYAAGGTFL